MESPATEPARRPRSPRGEGARLREDIVSGALDLLDETGESQAVTLRAVARRVGISAPSIYPHFRDPQAILLAVAQRAFGELNTHLRDAVASVGTDPVTRLLAMCESYLKFARERPRRYLVMFGGVWNAAAAVAEEIVDLADVTALGRASLDDFAACLRDCVSAGRSTSTDPAADATLLWAALHGLAHQRVVTAAVLWSDEDEARLIRRLAYL